jgi:hypothetical protein
MSLIILEGTDNSGKTTLIAKLHEAIDAPIVKPPSFNKIHAKGETETCTYLDWISGLFYQSRMMNILMDRHPIISTAVYENVLFNRNNLEKHYMYPLLRHEMVATNPIIVYCRPGIDVIRNYGDRPQMAGVKENTIKLLTAYDCLMSDYMKDGFTVLTYDWKDHYAYDRLLEQINKELARRA